MLKNRPETEYECNCEQTNVFIIPLAVLQGAELSLYYMTVKEIV